MTRTSRSVNVIAVLALVTAVALSAYAGMSGIRAVPVLTGSMRPHYGPGTLVFTRSVDTTTLRVGDVIAFRPPAPFTTPHNAPIMHRIVAMKMVDGIWTVRTRGDANPAPDPWTLNMTQTISHRVVGSVAHIGTVTAAIKNANSQVRMFSVGGVVLLSVALMLWPKRRPQKNSREFKFTSATFTSSPVSPSLASAPHELRTALTQVQGSVEMAMEARDHSDREALLAIANRGAERLTKTVEKLLFAAGLESWDSAGSVNVHEVIRRATGMGGFECEQILVDPNAQSALIDGNAEALRRATQGMIEHIHFATGRSDGVVVEIGGAEDAVVVTARTSNLPLADRTATWPEEASLNLALVQRMALDHGGSVTVDSAGGGVSVVLRVPRRHAAVATSAIMVG